MRKKQVPVPLEQGLVFGTEVDQCPSVSFKEHKE
jgi:hypothetical protein